MANTAPLIHCDAVEQAIAQFGIPEIFNTDQGGQFTGGDFIGLLTRHGIQISMDGRGCWRDNVLVERLWKSVKYEEAESLPRMMRFASSPQASLPGLAAGYLSETGVQSYL